MKPVIVSGSGHSRSPTQVADSEKIIHLVAFARYQSIETLTREILTDLVDHIKVYENGNISVHFKFADEFRKIAEYIEINTTDTAEAG